MSSNHQRPLVRFFGAGLMLALWLVMVLLTVSPQLHHLLHEDSQDATHHCLVTQLGDGSFITGDAGITSPVEPPAASFSAIISESDVSSATDRRLPSGRAPPATPSIQPVAG